MSRLVAGLAADKAARLKRDDALRETGRKAFTMQIELTNLLVTTKDAHEKLMLEQGYKHADRMWFAKGKPRR
jgi:hypothetical protein